MRSIILSTIFWGLNIGVLIGAVAYTRHEIQQAKFDAQMESPDYLKDEQPSGFSVLLFLLAVCLLLVFIF